MGSSPFFLDNYLTPEDMEEGIDYTDPLGVKKYKSSLPTEQPKTFGQNALDYFLRSTGLDQLHDQPLTGDILSRPSNPETPISTAADGAPNISLGIAEIASPKTDPVCLI